MGIGVEEAEPCVATHARPARFASSDEPILLEPDSRTDDV
jgi:hypothetical protein